MIYLKFKLNFNSQFNSNFKLFEGQIEMYNFVIFKKSNLLILFSLILGEIFEGTKN